MDVSTPTATQLDDLRSEVEQARRKRDLYRAMMASQSTANPERLGQLTRDCISAEDRLRRAELPRNAGMKQRKRSFGRG